MNLKSLYQKSKALFQPVPYAKNRLFSLRLRGGSGNRVAGLEGCRMKNCRITFTGRDNLVEIGDMSTLYGVSIYIGGSGNRVTIGPRNYLDGCAISIEDNGSAITLGEHTYIYGGTELAAIEGTRITLGSDCMLSSGISVRTGDSHSILTLDGSRINPSGDITLGDHVWVGQGAKILKNARIESDCIIGTAALVTGSTKAEKNAVLAGNPARVIRRGVTWAHERV